MADFHDRMTVFTDSLRASIEDRGESLAHVRQETVNLLGDARAFLDDVAREHKTRAEDLHEFLATTRANRDESVSAMRERHQEFLGSVAAEHQARAEDVNAFLADSRDHRMETVGAMRDSHREALDTMRDELRNTLDEANKVRHDTVDTMTSAFRMARTELSADLRGAAAAWRDFASHRNGRKTQAMSGSVA